MRFFSKISLFLVMCACLMTGSVFAQDNRSDDRFSVEVPYSLVQQWANNARFTFPKKIANFSRQHITILQYYLQSRAYNIPITGVFDVATRGALSVHQAGEIASLAADTQKNINTFFAFLYCPTGQTAADTIDFRLENVNKKRVLPSNYIPNNLVLELDEEFLSAGPVCMESESYNALRRMYKSAQAEGIDLYVTSSYRGEDSQDYLLKVMVKRFGDYAYRIVALPGRSEHNLGTSVDFAGFEDGRRVPLSASRQIAWLQNNAAEFGFVNSYPEGKEAITGFRAEPWHWRYIGPQNAIVIESENITLAEFFDQYSESIRRYRQLLPNSIHQLLEEIVVGG